MELFIASEGFNQKAYEKLKDKKIKKVFYSSKNKAVADQFHKQHMTHPDIEEVDLGPTADVQELVNSLNKGGKHSDFDNSLIILETSDELSMSIAQRIVIGLAEPTILGDEVSLKPDQVISLEFNGSQVGLHRGNLRQE